jgi:Abortive infection alpha
LAVTDARPGGRSSRKRTMMDPNSLIPISEEQAKAIQEASKALQEALRIVQGSASFLREMFGTVPEDVVALLGGNWLKVRRAAQLVRMLDKARERLRARRVEAPEPASLSIVLPIFVAAADESREELVDIWARLLAAAADPARSKSFRLAFIETAKNMDPLDAAVLRYANEHGGGITGQIRNEAAAELHASRDEVDVSIVNLAKLGLMEEGSTISAAVLAFGREFLRTVSD